MLFNDALNTFLFMIIWSWPYGKEPLAARVLFCAESHMIVHTIVFVIPVVENWLEQEIAQWVHRE